MSGFDYSYVPSASNVPSSLDLNTLLRGNLNWAKGFTGPTTDRAARVIAPAWRFDATQAFPLRCTFTAAGGGVGASFRVMGINRDGTPAIADGQRIRLSGSVTTADRATEQLCGYIEAERVASGSGQLAIKAAIPDGPSGQTFPTLPALRVLPTGVILISKAAQTAMSAAVDVGGSIRAAQYLVNGAAIGVWTRSGPTMSYAGIARALEFLGRKLELSGIVPTTGTTFSAAAGDNSFNDSGAGFPVLVAGDKLVSSGFGTGANNGTFYVVSRTASKIVVTGGTLSTEAAGATVTFQWLTPPKCAINAAKLQSETWTSETVQASTSAAVSVPPDGADHTVLQSAAVARSGRWYVAAEVRWLIVAGNEGSQPIFYIADESGRHWSAPFWAASATVGRVIQAKLRASVYLSAGAKVRLVCNNFAPGIISGGQILPGVTIQAQGSLAAVWRSPGGVVFVPTVVAPAPTVTAPTAS